MTIKRIWLMSLVIIALVSVAITASILTFLTDQTFVGYLSDKYDEHVQELLIYSAKAMQSDPVNQDQIAVDLESHLDDPIVEIKLYDLSGELLVSVEDRGRARSGMMNGMMMRNNRISEETDQFQVADNGKVLGTLNIMRESSTENTIVARLFKANLVRNSLWAVGAALVIAVITGYFVSRSMSKGLRDTATMARELELGKNEIAGDHYIREINQIRISLNELSQRLLIKSKSRKVLVDQMLHQTRTPLTILKMHLEAIEDGMVPFTPEEIKICTHQVDELTGIISNMSEMIDAERDEKKVKIENIDLNALVKLIANGLKPQFELKKIRLDLALDLHEKVDTDRYRISQVVYNLLTNAYKYSHEGGLVTVKTSSDESFIYVDVIDEGMGIAKQDQDKIFNAYYRISGVGHIQGEGMGLFIVKENLNAIGGEIRLTSLVGKGSTFRVCLNKISS